MDGTRQQGRRARRWLLAALIAAGAAFALAGSSGAQAPAQRPNVVVLMTDDQTLADMAALPRTQALIGAAGATFTQSYVSLPLCCPSRATFLTGQYAHNHGVHTNTPPHGGVEALDDAHTLPVWLRDAGYETIHIGKYLNGYGLRHRPRIPPGWTDWHATVDKSTYQMYGYTLDENGELNTYGDYYDEDPELYQTDVLATKAVQAIERHAPGSDPFFLSVAFVAPHGESVEPGSTTEPYLRPAPRHEGRFATLPLPPLPAYDELDVRDKPPAIERLRRFSPAQQDRILEDFHARRESLLAVDEAVASIVAALEHSGELDNTYIVFTSDNGFFQGEHRIPKGKYFAYDAATHVPLLVRGPGIAPGTVTDALVSNVDLAPTVLDAARASADRTLDGRSLLPIAREPALRPGRPVLHEGLTPGDNDRDGFAAKRARGRVQVPRTYFAVRTPRYLFVMWRGGGRELYDLAADPHELTSVHADPAYAQVRLALTAEVRRLKHCAGADCLLNSPHMRPPNGRARR